MHDRDGQDGQDEPDGKDGQDGQHRQGERDGEQGREPPGPGRRKGRPEEPEEPERPGHAERPGRPENPDEPGETGHPQQGPAGQGAGTGPQRPGGQSGRRPSPVVRRRALLLGGVAATAGVGYLLHETLERWWWRLPGNDRDRTAGAVDHPGAEWIAASEENLRRADRPYDWEIDRVVIHVVQGSYEVALKVFRDPSHGAATHYVVRGSDGHVAQMVRELDVAHHAGNLGYNQRSVGIEHEGFVDRPQDFTDVMYRSSAELTAGICHRYGIPVDREHIIGHHEVPGADHTDPGRHWDWDRYLRLVRAAYEKAASPEASREGAASPETTPEGQGSPDTAR